MAAKKAATTKSTAKRTTIAGGPSKTATRVPTKVSAGPAPGTGGTAARTSGPVHTDAPAATAASDMPPDSPPIQVAGNTSVQSAVSSVAAETLHGSPIWGTGRERDIRLKKAGLDPQAVADERNRLRREQKQKAAHAEQEANEERNRLRREARKTKG